MPGVEAALDGATAVALSEAMWCDAACLGASFPASVAARAWAKFADRINVFGATVSTLGAASASGALASAIGVSSAGRRATAFVSGHDLSSVEELLHQAAGSRVPLVLHAAARARTGHAVSFGGGHESWHAAADSGWAQLFAINTQEAVDLALVARLAAERSLTPVMVGMDGPETAVAVQDVRLPERALVRALLRSPSARMEPSTEAQRILFGDRRRVVPAWYDADEPVALGAAEPPALAQAGRLGAGEFFAGDVGPAITGAMARVSSMTGRELAPVLEYKTKQAELVIVAMGAAVETAMVAADRLRERTPIKAGVLGIRQTRPWPEEQVLGVLRRATSIVVLERTGTPMAGRGPLTREVLSTLACMAVTPTVAGAWHGVGGTACRASEIIEACKATFEGKPGPHLLGVGVVPNERTTPRERVVLDATRRSYPGLIERSHQTTGRPEPQLEGVTSVSVLRRPGAADEPASGLIAGVLHAVAGKRLRSRAWIDTPRPAEMAIDRLAIGDGALTPTRDLTQIAVMASPLVSGHLDPLSRLVDGGTLLVPLDQDGLAPLIVTRETLARAAQRSIKVMGVPVPQAKAYEKPEPAWRRHEAMAGAAARIAASMLTTKQVGVVDAAKARRVLFDDPDDAFAVDRLEVFEAGFEGVRELGAGDVVEKSRPAAVVEPRGAGAFNGSPVNDPGEHWARTGSGFARGRVAEATMDPFASAGLTPGRSSAPRAMMPQDDRLVVFVPDECTGSGALWTGGPDGSVIAAALGIEAILKAGMALAGGADALAPLVGKVAKSAQQAAFLAERGPESVRVACESVYAKLIEKMAPDAARREAMDSAFGAVMEAVGDLPIARTPALFDEREKAAPGTGAFIVLGCNPDQCAHAGAAAGEAIGHGLRLVERTEENLAKARRLWSMFLALPDTPGDVIEFARTRDGLGPLAAAMLARGCSMALSGGDDAEPGSGARLALRQVLAVCEAEVQPRWQRLVGEIDGLRGKLKEKIHQTLADAVPDEDLDALAAGLGSMNRDDVDLTELGRRVADASERPQVDGTALRLLVDAARELADLHWRLTEGPTGNGRARWGGAISLGPGTLWAGSAPFNPFGAPVMVDASMFSPELARGLFKSQVAESLRVIRGVRFAKAAIENPADAAKLGERLASLNWADLSDDERGVCPPVLLIGDDESLTRGALGSLLWLLETAVPVKVVLLSGAATGVPTGWGVDAFGSFPSGSGADAAMLALLSRKSYVVQASVAAGDHLADGVRGAMRFDGPALISVHAPSPGRHGFAPEKTLAQARLAVASRVWPLLRFDPAGEGVFGSCLSLDGNPEIEKETGGATPLDWAITEARFRELFTPGGDGVRVKDPLDGTPWVASAELVAFAEERMRLWRTLQEIAGVVTPFTERVKAEAASAVAAEREREIKGLKAEHEKALAELRAAFETEAVERVREGLLVLAGYGEGSGWNGEEPSPSSLRDATSPVGDGGGEEGGEA